VNYTHLLLLYFVVKWVIATKTDTLQTNSSKEEGKISINPINTIVGFIILTGLVQTIWGLMQLYDFTPSLHSSFKITGTFYNPAPYALYLSVVFPLALGVFLNIEVKDSEVKNSFNLLLRSLLFHILKLLTIVKTKSMVEVSEDIAIQRKGLQTLGNWCFKYIALLALLMILLILPATMIRAAWVSALVGSFLVLNGKYFLIRALKNYIKTRTRKVMLVILALLVIGATGLGLYKVKEHSSVGKLLIWEVTSRKIAEKPLFGHGVGRFEADYNNWQAEYFQHHPEEMEGAKGLVAGNTKYCFNEYLEMASEIGLVGLLLFISVIISVFYSFKNKSDNAKINLFYPKSLFTNNIIIPSLGTLFTAALLSYPFYSLPTLILLFTLAGIVSGSRQGIMNFTRIAIPVRVLGLSVALLLIFIAFVPLKKMKYYKAWQYTSYTYSTGDYPLANSEYQNLLPVFKYEGLLLQQYGKSLQMARRNNDAVNVMKEAKLLTSDNVLFTTLGDAYKGMKEYGKAEEVYTYAAYMEPNKLYPHYLLAKLYEASGQREKAVAKANEVLTLNVKVESTAVREIMGEMRAILGRE